MRHVDKVMAQYFGYLDFKPGQEEIIKNILQGRDTLGIMPTGGGKSLCYQLPALMLSGLTLVISPLIALMKDQVDALDNLGISASYINSSLPLSEIRTRLRLASEGKYKLLYIAPERLGSEDFITLVNTTNISLVAIDEAHCLSQWGHDFRPSYLSIGPWIKCMENRPIIAAFTATATPRVRQDIIEHLKLQKPGLILNSFNRDNLYFSVIKGTDRLKFITKYIKENPQKSGIIYAATRKEVEYIHDELNSKGYLVGKYHAGLSNNERNKYQEEFIYDRIQIIVATNAFGLGIDKSNVSYVIHHNMPRHIEAYYQEAGRAGRDGQKAECILLYHASDIQIQKFLIEQSEMSEEKKQVEYLKLQSMIDYCHSSRCLRQTMLEYFGEFHNKDNCGNCDNCLDYEIKDITIEAQKIFSCIYRMKEQYGSTLVAAVLKGSKQKRIYQLGFNGLSTYGIMSELATQEIVDYINLLTAEEYLKIIGGQYPVVKLDEKAIPVLRGQEKITLRYPKKEKDTTGANELFERLRTLRQEIALKQNVPPYVIFADKTLMDMCSKLPTDEESMLEINGVGQVKYDKYGEQFLEIIKEFLPNTLVQIRTDIETTKKITNNKKEITTETKEPTHITTWKKYNEGKTIQKIAEERNLTINTIETHLLRADIEGYQVNFSNFITPEQEQLIIERAKLLGFEKLKPIKEALPQEITYFAIKITLHRLQQGDGGVASLNHG